MNEEIEKAIANFIHKSQKVNIDKAMLNDSMDELSKATKKLYDLYCDKHYNESESFVNTSSIVKMDGNFYLLVFNSAGAPHIETVDEVLEL